MRRTIMLLTVGAIVAVVMAMSAAPAMAATPALQLVPGERAVLSTGNNGFYGVNNADGYTWAGFNAPGSGAFYGVSNLGNGTPEQVWLNQKPIV